MHIHTVYFWLSEEQNQAARAAFEQGLAALCADQTVTEGYYGMPANTDRDVVDSSYDYGLVLIFADTGKHDQYQVRPVHLQFVDNHAAKWSRVMVTDVITF